jgi:2-oxoisovalerate dehydrogenase E1 component
MDADRAAAVDRGFVDGVRAEPFAPNARDRSEPLDPETTLTGRLAIELFDAQLASRHADLAARWLKARDQAFYTIGSSGHEGNAAIAEALAVTDPAFLHYRSGAFFARRAAKAGYPHALRDVLLGVAAARDEPIAGGRHKVFGSVALAIPPQTSTIASHLPKAVGMALAIDRRRRLDVPIAPSMPADAIVMCSFGDASLNHSTALGAVNAACSASFQRLPVPILFVCEDNGLGISVPTPPGFIASTYGARPGLAYFAADGCDLRAAVDASRAAVAHVRERRAPALLHLRTVRLMGHAGADLEIAYRSADDILATEARDPVLSTARLLIRAGLLSPAEVLARYEAVRGEARALAEDAAARPKLASAAEVMAPLAPRDPERVAAEARRASDPEARRRFWGDRLPEDGPPEPLAGHINGALGDLLAERPGVLVFGEDVGLKGGVYGVTRGLCKRAGAARVFDTILDEQAILGLALGAGQLGLLPIPEIQYLAYLHHALDQIRGEGASLQFFSQGQYRCPMVVRVAGYAYQKGFGGHFHNDDSVAALRDIPGVVIASPALGEDAAAMLRTAAAAAASEGSVCLFLEPIALYRTADLHAPGDGLFASRYRRDAEGAAAVAIGQARVHGDGGDLLIVTFANGLWMSLRVAKRLAERGIHATVLDLRWLSPLPVTDLVREAQRCGRVLVVDETRASGGVSESVFTALIDAGFRGAMSRVASLDSFVPLGPAASLVLVSEAQIDTAAVALLGAAPACSTCSSR